MHAVYSSASFFISSNKHITSLILLPSLVLPVWILHLHVLTWCGSIRSPSTCSVHVMTSALTTASSRYRMRNSILQCDRLDKCLYVLPTVMECNIVSIKTYWGVVVLKHELKLIRGGNWVRDIKSQKSEVGLLLESMKWLITTFNSLRPHQIRAWRTRLIKETTKQVNAQPQ